MNDIIVRKFAIFALRPDAQWYFGDDENIVWLDEEQTEPTTAEIDAHIASTQYQRDRASAYDSVGDQLDQLMKDMRDGTTTHQTACEAVKAKYPKP
jgi:hypothetical protein